ncbi:amino acid adenylation domain-containing protein [Plantactinospora sp. WMMB334]|uniref:amino acid adenylation domain-containing protein n=1 Tax=Plantactinospora sp. WMMB334 TaxID=3404119 RepID=UPI003B93B7BA
MSSDRHRHMDDAGVAYWRERLDGLPVLELVTDRARGAGRRPVESSVALTLDPGVTARLDGLCAEHRVSRFTALVAVWQLLMGRYGNVRDVGVASPGRPGPGPGPDGTATGLSDGSLADLPDGAAANMTVIRASWADGPTFAAFLGRVRAAVLDAEKHGGLPPEGMAAAAGQPAEEPPWRVALAMADVPLGALDLAVTWRPDGPGGLRGTVRYDGTLFDCATVEQLTSHYTALLCSALAAPETPVDDLVSTTSGERAELAEWGGDTSADRPRNLVEGFHRQARERPDAVALVFDDETLSYGELLRRSEELAAALVRAGVGPESTVGLAMERSAALVVAMVAVVTAGAAYLPLDPEYPEARLALMVADSDACLVLTGGELSWTPPAPVLRMAGLTEGAAAVRFDHRDVHPDQRACVLYTSGSTGRPKGVATTHRGIVRLVCDAPFFACDDTDVVAQASSPAFDAASLEIWGALLNGARLAGIAKDDVLSTALLGERLRERAVTAMFLSTSVFHMHADIAPETFAPLRALYFGGEPADARRVAATRAVAPGVRLVNGYGPTECTTFASTFTAGDVDAAAARLPIGGPIPETTLYVLDGRGRQTGVGVPGELYIGGSGLARGYAGRPDLTAERFVPSPFGKGERLYRTGDLARWRVDGVLECLGRLDTQVKIRGVRIEPEEIASVLGTHPDVRAAVVEARGTGAAKRLAAYVVPQQGRAVAPRVLRGHLAAVLPEAMVPTWYVPLTELPLTPNGKVDRRALPAPAEADAVHAELHVAPRDATEELVARVWADTLGVTSVSATDDFLALGGNSLLATRVVAHLGAQLGVRLGIRDLFDAATVAGLATRLRTARRAETQPPLVTSGEGPWRLSHAQQRLWFLDRLARGNPLYNVSLVLTLEGRLDVPGLGAAVQDLVRRHPSLRTWFVVDGDDEPRQVVAAELAVRLEIDDFQDLPTEARRAAADAVMEHEVRRPFELSTGPLVRARLLRLAPGRHELLITMHHAICDGWSVGVLVDDLAAYYASAVAGTAPDLPSLPLRYVDFADWQRRLLDGGARDGQLAYWAEELSGAPPALDLPTDRPRPAVPRYQGNALPLRLPADLTARLTDTGTALGVTPFTTLVAVFQLLMGGYAGVRDVSVGIPVSGRTRPEFEQVVGCFINTLVLRTRWTDDLTFKEFLGLVRERTLGAYDHQDVPFEDIVEMLKPPRVPGRTPLAQVMVAMQNIPAGTARFPGLAVSVRELASPVAKLDLVMRWAETPADSGELRGIVEYDVDLFDRETVERTTRHFVSLLDAALAAPDAPVSALTARYAGDRAGRGGRGQEPPPPAPPAPGGDRAFAGELEPAIAAVWRDVLGLDTVATDDNFFEVGGTSLLILRLRSGLARATGRDVPVVDLFRFPTVAALARHLAAGGDGANPAGAAGRRRAAARRTLLAGRARKQDEGSGNGTAGRDLDQAVTDNDEAGTDNDEAVTDVRRAGR